jgi:alkylhydroperoxidase/carboxymuconolactone decarboxylase family protein YurZ
MNQELPPPVEDFEGLYPEVWEAFSKLGEACHESGGPLDEKARRLVKLALAIGLRQEGAVHSAVRQALHSGLSPDELRHVAVLAITTIGWPAAYAAFTWIEDMMDEDEEEDEDEE